MCFEIDALSAFADGNLQMLAEAFRNAIGFRCLAFRWQVLVPAASPTANIPISAWDTVKTAGPAILSHWHDARTCAETMIIAAHLDQEHMSPKTRAESWGKGTVDALLIYLYASAFDIPTHYEPVKPLVPVYRELLENWRTVHEETYRRVMHQAAEFHLECSGEGTNRKTYEFEAPVSQIFPFELLVIQALRRRDGLPAFDTGHALIDAPWAMLRALPETPPHPLLVRIEERLRADFPDFR